MGKSILVLTIFLALAAGHGLAQTRGGFLGAELAELTPDTTARLGVAIGNGALILGILPGSPAAEAGLKPNQVIMAVNGTSVGTPQEVVAAIGSQPPGARVTLLVVDMSNGFNQQNVAVTLAARPDETIASGKPTPATAPARNAAASAPLTGSQPIALQPLGNRSCRAEAPAGWRIADQDAQGSTLTLASADGRAIAVYAILGVSSGHAAGFYGPQFTAPGALAQFLASTASGVELAAAGAPQAFGGLQSLALASGGARGTALYGVYPLPVDPGGYVLSLRAGIGESAADERVASAVAATIQCSTALRPPSGGYASVEARDDIGTSASCQAGDCDESDLAGTYNAQLGTGYVHSESGENYLVDVSRDYREDGPDGPGYYRQSGNFLERLEPGRAD